MSRAFRTADYVATLEVQVRLGDCLPSAGTPLGAGALRGGQYRPVGPERNVCAVRGAWWAAQYASI